MSDEAAQIGERIRAARSAAGLTQVSLADAVGVRQQYMWRIEDGRSTPSGPLLARIAQRLGTSAVWLALGEGEAMAESDGRMGGPPPAWAAFLETREGKSTTEVERHELLSYPWRGEPTVVSYTLMLTALRAAVPAEDAGEGAEETEMLLERAKRRGG